MYKISLRSTRKDGLRAPIKRLQGLMLSGDLDAASAGFKVGYENPSYFSRDYKKQFGAPPQRDIARLRSNLEV